MRGLTYAFSRQVKVLPFKAPVVIALLTAWHSVTCGQSALQPVDLLSLYKKALVRDPVFEAAGYALEGAHEKIPQAKSAFLPTVLFNASVGKQFGDVEIGKANTPFTPTTVKASSSNTAEAYQPDVVAPTIPFAETPGQDSVVPIPDGLTESVNPAVNDDAPVDRKINSRSWSFQLSLPLIKPAAWVGIGQAESQVSLAQAQFQAAQQEHILRVVQAYLDILVAKESLAVAQRQLTAMEAQLTLAKRNFEVGTSTITDVHEAKSRYELSRSQKVAAVNDEQVKLAELEKIVGEPSLTFALLNPKAKMPVPEPSYLNDWVVRAKDQNPGVKEKVAGLEVAEKEVNKLQAGHLPTLDFSASRGPSYTSGSMSAAYDTSTKIRSTTLGMQFSMPLYSGGLVVSKVAEASIAVNKAKAELEANRRNAMSQARQAFYGVLNGTAQIEALEAAIEASKQSVDANKIGYRIGTRINVDVLNAEQQYFSAQRDLAKAKAETLMQGLKLKAAVGALTERDVVAVNDLLVFEHIKGEASKDTDLTFKLPQPCNSDGACETEKSLRKDSQ